MYASIFRALKWSFAGFAVMCWGFCAATAIGSHHGATEAIPQIESVVLGNHTIGGLIQCGLLILAALFCQREEHRGG